MNANQTAAINACADLHATFFAYTEAFNAADSKDIDSYTEVAMKAMKDTSDLFNSLSDEDKDVFGPNDYLARLGFNKHVYAILDAQKSL